MKCALFFFLCSGTLVFAVAPPIRNETEVIHPWFTGPLLSTSAHIVTRGNFNLEPYFFVNTQYGKYDTSWHLQKGQDTEHNLNLQLWWDIGLSDFLQLIIVPQFFYNYTMSTPQSSFAFGDLRLGIEWMLTKSTAYQFALKFGILETFPTGQFEQFDVGDTTEGGGSGSYITEFRIATERMWHLGGIHFLDFRIVLLTFLYSHVQLQGKNTYGGDATTNGWINPGANFSLLFSEQISITRNWAIAMDWINTFIRTDTFKGTTVKAVGNTSWQYQMSLSPALEYNFNQNAGLIFGCWFSLFGRNAPAFANAVIALNCYL
ncbi:MAG: hypothetical protein A3F09_01675 [Chlamydiae bacterium RIFCSPHIGHO2_12_FULL_49_11]|nr:MAG: hypothetical protein A3F09_01675 [Chlamydiae bacterium RIFCSPHIGHO2_12_FULL_49_11]